MGRKILIAAGAAVCLLMASSTAPADPSWVGPPYTHTIPTHITNCGQVVSSSLDLTLDHDVGCNIYFTAAGDDYLLKNGGTSLATDYKLTGGTLDHQDADWITADQFARIANTYAILGTGTSVIKLWGSTTAPGVLPLPAGNYTATLTVTATW